MSDPESYDALLERFRWETPEFFNIGVDICDTWAEREPDRLAILHVGEDGTAEEQARAWSWWAELGSAPRDMMATWLPDGSSQESHDS